MEYDYLIVGAGFFGAICAHELTSKGFKVLVIDKRNHIGGNCHTETRDGINVHTYGPHIFHTSNEEVWKWINNFTDFNDFTLRPLANFKGEIFSLPFNMWTFSKLWNISLPEEARQIIREQSKHITAEPRNLEEQAIKLVGVDIYQSLIKGYTEKQWRKMASELPKEIIKRLPVRFTYDNNYFNDKYQGIPIGGYTQIFFKLLKGIDVRLNTNYLESREYFNSLCNKVIYTGPIDAFFDYKFGDLEYKTTRFEHKRLDLFDYQGTAMMNFTDIETPHTRVIEYKHFEMGEVMQSPVTWVSWEFPEPYDRFKEAYYPVNDADNNEKYRKYFELSKLQNKVLFGGRLAEYKYYDMHQVIESSLNFVRKISDKDASSID